MSGAPTVILAAGTCTGAGTTVALVEACRTLSEQVASGRIESAEVRIPVGATQARAAAAGLDVKERSRAAAILEELFDRSSSDVYIGFADRLPLRARSASTQIMVVQNPHLYEASDAPSVGGLGGLGRQFLTRWAARSAAAADLIICATQASSDAVRNAISGLDAADMEVRPIRPRTPPPRDHVSASIERIVLLGDLYAYKRFDVAIDGIAEWYASSGGGQPVEGVHCGNTRDEAGAAAFAASVKRTIGTGVDVIVRGGVSHEEALGVLLTADLFISASETETQGLTILESMAVGVPVVAREIGPIESLAAGAYEPFSVDGGANEIAEAIRQVEGEPRRQELVAAGLTKANMVVGWNLLPVV